MKRLRSGVVASLVAFLTCCTVMFAGPAMAGPNSTVPPVPDASHIWSPWEAYNYIEAWLNQHNGGMCNDSGLCKPTDPRTGETCWECEIPENPVPGSQYFPSMQSLVAMIGGTPAQVELGEKIVAKGCKSGYACIAALAAAFVAAGLFTTEMAVPWIQAKMDEMGAPEPVFRANTLGNKCGVLGEVTGNPFRPSPDQGFTISVTRASGGGYDYCGPSSQIAVDCHLNGQWDHRQVFLDIGGPQPAGSAAQSVNVGFQLCQAGWEVRLIHFVGAPVPLGGGIWGDNAFDRGFYWGYELPPESTDSIESLTRCARPDGSTYDVVTVEPASSGLAAVPACNAGDTPVYVQTTLVHDDGTRDVQTAQRLDTQAPAAEQFPLCVQGGCKWLVKADGVPCTVGAAACVDWARDKSDNTCWYGPYQMPLALCNMLERSYQQAGPEEVPLTEENTDGDPDTHTGPVPQLEPTPTPSSTATTTTLPSPTTTGQPTGQPTATVTPTTGSSASSTPTSTATSTPNPTGGPSPTPSVPGGSGTPDPNDPQASECFPSGWGMFNPVQWVLMPIRCAFEPDNGNARNRIDNLRTQFEERGVGPLITAVVETVGSIPDEGGCEGPAYTFNVRNVHQTLHPFSACDEPMATVAEYGKALATLTLIVSGGLAVIRAVGSGFGWDFSMKGGKSSGD